MSSGYPTPPGIFFLKKILLLAEPSSTSASEDQNQNVLKKITTIAE